MLYSITVIRGCGLNLYFICLALNLCIFLALFFSALFCLALNLSIASVAAAFISSYPLFSYSRTFII